MTVIVLNDEQVQALNESVGDIELQDATGHSLGIIAHRATHSFTPEEIAESKRRAHSGGPWLTTKELLERMTSQDRSQ